MFISSEFEGVSSFLHLHPCSLALSIQIFYPFLQVAGSNFLPFSAACILFEKLKLLSENYFVVLALCSSLSSLMKPSKVIFWGLGDGRNSGHFGYSETLDQFFWVRKLVEEVGLRFVDELGFPSGR